MHVVPACLSFPPVRVGDPIPQYTGSDFLGCSQIGTGPSGVRWSYERAPVQVSRFHNACRRHATAAPGWGGAKGLWGHHLARPRSVGALAAEVLTRCRERHVRVS
jgi:hypothetical protein